MSIISTDLRGHLGTSYSPDDPIFWLLHGFVDFAYALWQDFYEFEIMHKDYITTDAYDGQASGISGIDDVLSFEVLLAQDFVKTITASTRIRDVHSITEMGYQYHVGTFISDSKIYTCGLNSDWFVGVMQECEDGGSSTPYTEPDTNSYSYSQPATDTYGAPVTDTYSVPVTDTYSEPATDTYAAPDTNYGAPMDSNYAAPDTYSEPATDTYAAPATDTYGAPVTDTYAAPDTIMALMLIRMYQ